MKLRHVVVVAFVLALLGYLVDAGSGTDEEPAPTGTTAGPTPGADDQDGREEKTPQGPPAPDAAPETLEALAVLDTLRVKGRAPMTGYDRDRFGPAWLDADRNGCDTRNDVLAEHLADVRLESNGCVVTHGRYRDLYTGERVDFYRGHGALLDIDHVVALGNAWATGAFGWSAHKRAAFANDPLNLLPADAGANRQKGDGDAATWLPPNRPFRCEYVARQVSVKAKYRLWVTPAEKAAATRVLDGCPGQRVVVDEWGAPTRVDHDIAG